MGCGETIKIDASDEDNELDLLTYLKVCLPSLPAGNAVNPSAVVTHSGSSFCGLLPEIIKKCEGSFLYASHVQHELCKREDLDRMTFKDIMSVLPHRMGSVYHTYFHRLEKELKAIMNKKPDLYKLLEILIAANKFLPLKFVARALGLNLDCRNTKRIINEVNEAVSCLLYVSNDEVTVFHKSVYDWLLGIGYDDHEYTVKASDGKKRMWLLCEQIFKEMKNRFRPNLDLKLTNDTKYALEHGHKYLLACNVTDSLYWLVDTVIVYVQTAVHAKCIRHLKIVLEKVLRSDVAITLKLRQRMSWHLLEVCPLEYFYQRCFGETPLVDLERHFSYLEAIRDRSPEGLFTNDEKEIVKALIARTPPCLQRISVRERTVSLPLVKLFPSPILTVGVSLNRKLIAVALKDGTVCVLGLPDLVKLWEYPTAYRDISCCTIAPDGSIVLYGKLKTALSITEKREISFFNGYEEMFKTCAFSPSGNRLVTSDSSSTVKLWDVVRRCLLTVLCAEHCLDFCDFSNNGLSVIADQKNREEDAYCVWNSITLQ